MRDPRANVQTSEPCVQFPTLLKCRAGFGPLGMRAIRGDLSTCSIPSSKGLTGSPRPWELPARRLDTGHG
jgi:hypothetical protein